METNKNTSETSIPVGPMKIWFYVYVGHLVLGAILQLIQLVAKGSGLAAIFGLLLIFLSLCQAVCAGRCAYGDSRHGPWMWGAAASLGLGSIGLTVGAFGSVAVMAITSKPAVAGILLGLAAAVSMSLSVLAISLTNLYFSRHANDVELEREASDLRQIALAPLAFLVLIAVMLVAALLPSPAKDVAVGLTGIVLACGMLAWGLMSMFVAPFRIHAVIKTLGNPQRAEGTALKW